jgi:hypothetical protein
MIMLVIGDDDAGLSSCNNGSDNEEERSLFA